MKTKQIMRRYIFLAVLALSLLVPTATAGAKRPNVLFLVTDDQQESIRSDVERVSTSAYLGDIVVGGFLYDVDTGKLERIC